MLGAPPLKPWDFGLHYVNMCKEHQKLSGDEFRFSESVLWGKIKTDFVLINPRRCGIMYEKTYKNALPVFIRGGITLKLLRISAKGLPLFKKELVLTFFAQQRVSEMHRNQLFQFRENYSYYINSVNAFIGINASGKTSTLKVILLALNILNNEPINHIETRDILGNSKRVVLNIYFLSDSNELCRLETIIIPSTAGKGRKYAIEAERLWAKPMSSATAKKDLTDFDALKPCEIRQNDEIFLPEDTSIIIAYNKKNNQRIRVENLLSLTNMNVLPFSEDIPSEIITYLDPTVEKLVFNLIDNKISIRLKFKGEKEIILSDSAELNQYLSSGTIKGIVVFKLAIDVLSKGGYLVIDELENHFNKEIVATLIRFFMDSSINSKGGTLIFSTHYPEILDEFDRNDCIYILRNREGIEAENLMEILKRNDLKKSDAYQSGYLEGTAPTYEAYLKLKKSIISALHEEE